MLRLLIPSNKKFLPLINSFIDVSTEVFGIREIRERIELCAEEAFVYLLKNSYEEEEGELEIRIEIDQRHFVLSFIDKGLPIDIAFPSLEIKGPDSIDPEGLELLLIKKFSHKAEWINHGKEGREFKLYFELPQRPIYSQPQPEPERGVKVSPEDIIIERFRPEWAIEISQIIYKAYGYSYPNEDLYFPERVVSLNKSGQLVSVVAFDTKHKKVAGHYALEREDLGSVAEIGQAVVAPAYRGMGLMKKIRLKTQEVGRELGLEGIMSKPVTVHLFSQKTNESLGAVPVGVGFGVSPVKDFKAIDADASQRGSCMYYYLPLKKRERSLCIPRRHRKFIEQIYRDLNLSYRLCTEAPDPVPQGRVRSSYSPYFETGSIYVTRIGTDSLAYIKNAFFDLTVRMGARAVLLYVTMEDRDVETLTEELEKNRFFFSGVLPSFVEGKDVLIYQFLAEDIDESRLQIYSDRAKEIVAYVSREKGKCFDKNP